MPRKFKGWFSEASRVFQVCFKEISGVFQESFKGVSSKIDGHLNRVVKTRESS